MNDIVIPFKVSTKVFVNPMHIISQDTEFGFGGRCQKKGCNKLIPRDLPFIKRKEPLTIHKILILNSEERIANPLYYLSEDYFINLAGRKDFMYAWSHCTLLPID